jgi:hypothetical protein
MRKIEFNVYHFNELSEKSKKVAIKKSREHISELNNDSVGCDYRESLKEFEKIFGLYRVEIDEYDGFNILWSGLYADEFIFSFDERTDTPIYLRELHGKLLWRYLQNNIFPLSGMKEYYLWPHQAKDGRTKTRTSRITYYEDDECGLTGLYCDYPLVQPFVEWMKHPDNTTTYESLVKKAVSGFIKAWNRDIEYGSTDEFVEEELKERDLEFRENGDPYDFVA